MPHLLVCPVKMTRLSTGSCVYTTCVEVFCLLQSCTHLIWYVLSSLPVHYVYLYVYEDVYVPLYVCGSRCVHVCLLVLCEYYLTILTLLFFQRSDSSVL